MFMLTPFERKTNLLLDDFFDDFDRHFFAPAAHRSAPRNAIRAIRTDIKDNGDSFLLEAELPGFEKDEISVDIDGDYLTISAEKKADECENSGGYIRKERFYGKSKRTFSLEGIDAANIGAKFANGILALNLPKIVETPKETRKLNIE